MIKPLGFLLLMSIVSFAADQARGSDLTCESAFGQNAPTYRSQNPSAAQRAADYPSINQRTMRMYSSTLLGSPNAYSKLIRSGDVVFDIGGGRGQAMWDLANSMPVEAVVINTQDFTGEFKRAPQRGHLSYRTGWAEEVLPLAAKNSVDFVFDMYGAFTYSPRKDLIVQETLRILKPGGRAFLLFDHDVTRAYVQTSNGLKRFDTYLVEQWPDTFASRPVVESGRTMHVIEIRKPKGFLSWFNRAIDLSLPIDVIHVETVSRGRTTVPQVLFREI